MKQIHLRQPRWVPSLAEKKQTGASWYTHLLQSAGDNRILSAAVIILVNVTIAALSIPFLGLGLVSIATYCVFMTPVFLTNALVLAQVPMKWTIPVFSVSIFANAGVFVYGVSVLLSDN